MGEEYARRLPTELEIKILQHIADEGEGHHRVRACLQGLDRTCAAAPVLFPQHEHVEGVTPIQDPTRIPLLAALCTGF